MAAYHPDHARRRVAFLRHLRRTGNATLAAEAAGAPLPTMRYHQRRDPDFAQDWAAAVAFAEAGLKRRGGKPPGEAGPEDEAAITRGGEFTVAGSNRRRLQVRRSRAGVLSHAGERRFLTALAATANVRLSAETVGISRANIYRRARCHARFGREMRAALKEGYDRVELALVDSAIRTLEPDGTDLAGWGHDAAEPEAVALIGRITVAEAIWVYIHHGKVARQGHWRRQNTAREPTMKEVHDRLLREIERVEKRAARDQARAAARAGRGKNACQSLKCDPATFSDGSMTGRGR